jgi:tRNA(adenine34) deaminase
MRTHPSHEDYMALALEEAEKARALGEVPVGSVIVYRGEVLARTHNLREDLQDPSAHAEFLAIQAAARILGTWRLEETQLYVTLEPCPMCAGAIIMARVPEVYFGAYDPKAGCCGSLMNLLADTRFNHQPVVTGGILEEPCGEVLKKFFRNIRTKQRAARDAARAQENDEV